MNWKTWSLLFLALVAGSVASIGVKMAFFTEKDAQADAESDDFIPKERLLVANGALPAGTELNAQNVRLTLTSERDVPRDGIFTFDGIAGRKTSRDLRDGEAISIYDLESSEETQTDDVSFVPPGYVVVPIEICSATKATGGVNYLKTTKLNNIVKSGDVVDLVVVKEDVSSRDKRRLISDSVAEDVSVFAVRDESRRTSDGTTRSSILSALLSKEQVAIIRKASEEGKIKVVVRSNSDLSYEEQEDQNDFLNGGFYSSIKNNDAILSDSVSSSNSPSDDSDRSTRVFNEPGVGYEAETGLLEQNAVEASNEGVGVTGSKSEKGVFMTVSRKVETVESDDEILTGQDEESYEVQDDVLSDSETIPDEENVETSDDVLTEKYLIDEKEDKGARLISVRKSDAENEDNLQTADEDVDALLLEAQEDGDAKSCAVSKSDAGQKVDDGAQEVKTRPRVFSPYATRGTGSTRRRAPRSESVPSEISQNKVI